MSDAETNSTWGISNQSAQTNDDSDDDHFDYNQNLKQHSYENVRKFLSIDDSSSGSIETPKILTKQKYLQNVHNIDLKGHDLKNTLIETIDLLIKYTKSDDGTAFITDGTKIQKVIKTSCGITTGLKWPVETGTTLAAYVAATMKPICINHFNVCNEGEQYPMGPAKYEQQPICVICLPALAAENTVTSVFELVRFSTNHYNKAEFDFAQKMINWMAQALNKKLTRFGTNDWHIDFNDLLLKIFHQFTTGEIDCDALISQIMIKTRDYIKGGKIIYYVPLNLERCEVLVYHEGSSDVDKLFRAPQPLSVWKENDSLLNYVWNSRKYIIVAGEELKRFDIDNFDVTSILCVPIASEKQLFGIVKVINKYDQENFTVHDAVQLRLSAIYCALAFQQQRDKVQLQIFENIYEDQLKSVMYYAFGCEHDTDVFTNLVHKTILPEEIYNFEWYPNNDQLPYLAEYIWWMFKHFFKDDLFFDKFIPFLMAVRHSYRHIPYHNFEHAFIVTHTLFVIIISSPNEFTQFEKTCLLIAGLCHDIDHPGFSSQFLIFSDHAISHLHPDSPLEHHHSNICRMFIKHYKLFSHLSEEEQNKYMKEIHDLIICTDIHSFQKHSLNLEQLLNDNEYDNIKHRTLLKHMMMTTSDLAAQAKPLPYNQRLAARWYEELFVEGAEYKRRDANFFYFDCDTKMDELTTGQVKFMEDVCLKSADLLRRILPNTQLLYNLYEQAQEKWKFMLPFARKIEEYIRRECSENLRRAPDFIDYRLSKMKF